MSTEQLYILKSVLITFTIKLQNWCGNPYVVDKEFFELQAASPSADSLIFSLKIWLYNTSLQTCVSMDMIGPGLFDKF